MADFLTSSKALTLFSHLLVSVSGLSSYSERKLKSISKLLSLASKDSPRSITNNNGKQSTPHTPLLHLVAITEER